MSLTPQQIVDELDRHIVGQQGAKRAVAIALRNRWRRQQVDESLRGEITPKNILMIGPTGVGKTEIARRLAKLADAPFIKVEATKFTEVGYVGKDVDTIVRDLVESAVKQERARQTALLRDKARKREAYAARGVEAIAQWRDGHGIVPVPLHRAVDRRRPLRAAHAGLPRGRSAGEWHRARRGPHRGPDRARRHLLQSRQPHRRPRAQRCELPGRADRPAPGTRRQAGRDRDRSRPHPGTAAPRRRERNTLCGFGDDADQALAAPACHG